MLPDRAGQAKRAAPPQAGRRRQGLKPGWVETGNRARFTKARSWPWPGDAMSRLLRIRLDRRAQRARQPSVTSGALSGCQRSLGLALIQRSGHAGIDLDQHSCGQDTPQGACLAIATAYRAQPLDIGPAQIAGRQKELPAYQADADAARPVIHSPLRSSLNWMPGAKALGGRSLDRHDLVIGPAALVVREVVPLLLERLNMRLRSSERRKTQLAAVFVDQGRFFGAGAVKMAGLADSEHF